MMTKPTSTSLTTDCNCSALRKAARSITRLYDEALAVIGLGVNQYAILAKLERFGPQGLGDLAEILVMDRSTVGHLLRPLERRGLVTIETGPTDGRKRVVALSAAGQRLMAEAAPLWSAAQVRFEREFGAEEAQSMRRMLARVVAANPRRMSTGSQEITR